VVHLKQAEGVSSTMTMIEMAKNIQLIADVNNF
jgi:hypothetical protein